MTLSNLEFFIREALIGLKRSSLMMVISIATVTISMLIFGFFLLFSVNLNNLADFFVSKLEIRVFLNDNLTRREKRNFQDLLSQDATIKAIEFVSKETAWETLKTQYEGSKLSTYITKNPLPDTLIVRLRAQSDIQAIATTIESYKTEVEQVVYGGLIATQIQKFSKWSKIGGILLVTLLLIATLMIIANTIRLTIIARQNEIDIMRLVGATKSFIRWPFLIEGFLIGCVGTTLSLLILNPTYATLATAFQKNFPFIPVIFNIENLMPIYSFLGITGIMLGILGAGISVTRTLRRQPNA